MAVRDDEEINSGPAENAKYLVVDEVVIGSMSTIDQNRLSGSHAQYCVAILTVTNVQKMNREIGWHLNECTRWSKYIADFLQLIFGVSRINLLRESRPLGRRLLEDAHLHKFDQLLIFKLDRLGRDTRLILNTVAELEKHGVRVRSMTERAVRASRKRFARPKPRLDGSGR